MSGFAKAEFSLADMKIEDTNLAGIGTDEDKASRKSAAKKELAWNNAGNSVGLQIWRIEKFEVKAWPKEMYGKFFTGDSYIILKTKKVEDKLIHDIHFWLGLESTADEQGTAAYKTVELDDLMDQEPTQYREVQMHESKEFQSLFKSISYLKGGVESGFNHVEAGAFAAKLLHVKKVGKVIKVVEVPCERASLNHGDSFVLDCGNKIYIWSGDDASPFEKNAANNAAENLEGGRAGKAKATHHIDASFWDRLGGEGAITSAADAPDCLPTAEAVGEGILFRLSDSTGSLTTTEVARGDLKAAMLTTGDVYIVDCGAQLFVWVGKGASALERRSAMISATNYMKAASKPLTTPVTVFKEGEPITDPVWVKIFD